MIKEKDTFEEFYNTCKEILLSINNEIDNIEPEQSILYDLHFDSLTYVYFVTKIEELYLCSFMEISLLDDDNDMTFKEMILKLYSKYKKEINYATI